MINGNPRWSMFHTPSWPGSGPSGTAQLVFRPPHLIDGHVQLWRFLLLVFIKVQPGLGTVVLPQSRSLDPITILDAHGCDDHRGGNARSEEHTSELQSLR